MNSLSVVRILAFVLACQTAFLTGCPKPQSSGSPSGDTRSAGETQTVAQAPPLIITVERMKDESALGLDIYVVEVQNLDVPDEQSVGVHFVYDANVPTGEATFLYEDPVDPSKGYKKDANGPIVYRVVETVTKRVESWGKPDEYVRSFSIEIPKNALNMKYWVEVVTRQVGGEGTEVFNDVPYATMSEVVVQGGPITEIPN